MARCSFYNDSKSQLTSDLSDEARAMTRVPVIYNFFEEYLFLLNYIIIDARVIWERSVRERAQAKTKKFPDYNLCDARAGFIEAKREIYLE